MRQRSLRLAREVYQSCGCPQKSQLLLMFLQVLESQLCMYYQYSFFTITFNYYMTITVTTLPLDTVYKGVTIVRSQTLFLLSEFKKIRLKAPILYKKHQPFRTKNKGCPPPLFLSLIILKLFCVCLFYFYFQWLGTHPITITNCLMGQI